MPRIWARQNLCTNHTIAVEREICYARSISELGLLSKGCKIRAAAVVHCAFWEGWGFVIFGECKVAGFNSIGKSFRGQLQPS